MYRVLIADDEILVRLALKNSIDWDKYDMMVIADANNGQAAWEVYEREKPDLVITDIKMPVMDGMEFIRRIRERGSKTVIIILSCLEDFELLRQALSLDISGYILKLTMSDDEIDKVLLKARDEMEKNISRKSEAVVKLDNNVLKEEVFKRFLFYGDFQESEFEKHVNELKLFIKPHNLLVCLMEIDHFSQMKEKFNDKRGQMISLSIFNIINEVLKNYQRVEVIHDVNQRYIIFFSFHDINSEQRIHEELYSILGHIRKALKSYFNSTVSFGISSLKDGYASLGDLYTESENALKQKFHRGLEKYLTLREQVINKPADSVRAIFAEIQNYMEMLNEAVRKGIIERAEMLLSSYCLPEESIKNMLFEWMHWLCISLNVNSGNMDELLISYHKQVQSAETLEEACEAYKRYIYNMIDIINKKNSLSREVVEAVQFIHAHYPAEIDLQQVADYTKLSPNYLSSLLKKETGLSFIEYLNQVRIENAKKLLLNTSMKSYEIAEKVGFASDSYFSRAFKKMTNMGPYEFRRSSSKTEE
jgi:Response regulator containing CheY-like receiver domain and AraC-type DNA-binding domain